MAARGSVESSPERETIAGSEPARGEPEPGDAVPGEPGGARRRARITEDPIDPTALAAAPVPRAHGAALLFLGVVRDHADERAVEGLRYDAYREMAEEELGRIVADAEERFGVTDVEAVHRIGALDIGEPSVAVRVSSAHRGPAYEASRWIMEEIKARLPVWKEERYADGQEAWVVGRDPRERPTAPPAGDGGEGP